VEEAMPAGQQDKRDTGPQKQGLDERVHLIGRDVLRCLGRPASPHRVEVRHLWAEYYRVNVLVEVGTAAVRIAHSYFLVTDESGAILLSSPGITKQY
jgi:hypothetical protein